MEKTEFPFYFVSLFSGITSDTPEMRALGGWVCMSTAGVCRTKGSIFLCRHCHHAGPPSHPDPPDPRPSWPWTPTLTLTWHNHVMMLSLDTLGRPLGLCADKPYLFTPDLWVKLQRVGWCEILKYRWVQENPKRKYQVKFFQINWISRKGSRLIHER